MNKEITPRGITLTLTEACNLRCTYCYEKNKSPKTMTIDTALSIVEREMADADGPVTFDFFGGEPFLQFDLMRRICEYTWGKKWNVDYKFFVSTNGTLLTSDIKKWLEEHKEQFWCGLSYDGTPQMQNINRDHSASKIDLDFFARNWPTQGVKMTISRETLPNLAEGVIFLHKKGFRVNCNLAYGPDWTDKSCRSVLEEQLLTLIDYYLENPDVKPCSMLDMEIIFVSDSAKREYTKWCGAGTNMRVYSPDGVCYPCHFFEPLSIGEELARKSLLIDFSKPAQLMDHDCQGCCLLPICPTCYGSNYAATGDVAKKDKALCSLTKIQAMANSYFKYRVLSESNDEELGITIEQRKLLTDAILAIQSAFSE